MVALRSICVFCGSSTPPDARYRNAARGLGALLARRGIGLVYGGGRVGLMGELADAALSHGGRVTGVILAGLFSREIGHTGVADLREVGSMHERKQLMYDLSGGSKPLGSAPRRAHGPDRQRRDGRAVDPAASGRHGPSRRLVLRGTAAGSGSMKIVVSTPTGHPSTAVRRSTS